MAKAHSYKFCFGPWNISEGQDPYGPTTRSAQTFDWKLAALKKLGFDAMMFHDDDAVPDIDGKSATQIAREAKELKKRLDGEGVTAEMVAPRLWFSPNTIDGAYIGPTDLALALGLPPVMDNDEPKHIATVNRILEACKRHNKIAGMHTSSSKFTQRYLDQGFKMVMLGTDRVAMSNYMKAEVGRLTGWTPLVPVGAPDKGGY